ncbi:MAG TPA: amidohydrolase [Jatrophihabitantaceae bacterium]
MTAVRDVVEIRRELHSHPELAYHEKRTTELLVDRLRGLGLEPEVLPAGTGVHCDIGSADGPLIALRADIDALPIADQKNVSYRSTVDGVCHGCGHDAHTAILLSAAGELAARDLDGRVRLIFQPAEETVPGGATAAIAAGVLDGVQQIYALHCDPRIETGSIGLRTGAITAACDQVRIAFSGPGGHTARPHLTADLVYAIGRVITDLPGLLSRRVDPRSGVSIVWGSVDAGRAANAIPMNGTLVGTLRVLDREAWRSAEPLVRSLVDELVAPTGVTAEVDYARGVPPVMNASRAVDVQRAAVLATLGNNGLVSTEQSMGAEDFAWYLESVPGALARLGVRAPGGAAFDLHQGTFDIDENALEVGVRYTVALAEQALKDTAG